MLHCLPVATIPDRYDIIEFNQRFLCLKTGEKWNLFWNVISSGVTPTPATAAPVGPRAAKGPLGNFKDLKKYGYWGPKV